jgi:hypothetical protein
MPEKARPEPLRSRAQRKADALAKLRGEVDLWVASADKSGRAHLIPLPTTGTGRRCPWRPPVTAGPRINLARAGWARVAVGSTRDVVIVEGPVEQIPIGADRALEDAHARATGFDPRELAEEYVYLRITPDSVQAWRESNELPGRRLMRGGVWLD